MKEFFKPIVENLGEFLGRLTSRKFIGALCGVLLPILNRVNNWGLTDGEILQIEGIITVYIIGNIIETKVEQGKV